MRSILNHFGVTDIRDLRGAAAWPAFCADAGVDQDVPYYHDSGQLVLCSTPTDRALVYAFIEGKATCFLVATVY